MENEFLKVTINFFVKYFIKPRNTPQAINLQTLIDTPSILKSLPYSIFFP